MGCEAARATPRSCPSMATPDILPAEILAIIDAYEMLQSLYCMDGEFEVQGNTEAVCEAVREGCSGSHGHDAIHDDLHFILNVSIDEDKLEISMPLHVTLA